MGNSGWGNDELNTIVLPPGALPGQTRIVIGPDLPPPLDTYLVGGFFKYATGIIFYRASPTNDDYLYLCELETPSTSSIHIGAVLNGAVLEVSPGRPWLLDITFDGAGVFAIRARASNVSFQDTPLIVLPNGSALGWGNIGAGIATAGTATSAGAEVALASAAWTVEPQIVIQPDHVYRFTWKGNMFISGGTIALALGAVRIRIGQASIAGTLIATTDVAAQTNFAPITMGGDGIGWFTGIVPDTFKTVSITVQKTAGTGTNLNLQGDALAPLVLEVEDLGTMTENIQWLPVAVPFT